MDNQTLALINNDISIAVRGLQKLILAKQVIAELDKTNRIRKIQRLPKINYDIQYVEHLCDTLGGHGNYKKLIIEIVKNEALTGVIR